MSSITRRAMMALSAQAAVVAVATSPSQLFGAPATGRAAKYRPAFAAIDRFANAYLCAMNAPGMTLVVADADGVLRTSVYGLSDLERKTPVTPSHLFHIGSITKSFTAIVLLQLRDEGKLDLHAPITRYLPWLKIKSSFAPVTTHHLLSHSSGIPGASVPPLFTADATYEIPIRYAPGERYYYSNLAFNILGQLIRTLDQRPFAESFRRRILAPLAMNATAAVISPEIRERTVLSYVPYSGERPHRRHGALAPAADMVMADAAGSVASTPADMGRYIQMLIRGGLVDARKVISKKSFDEMTAGHVKVSDATDAASYGYGLFIDKLDGHRLIRHTGGMVSFMSAMQIDLDAKVGAFASINAQQGYRPNPVVAYALRCVRAVNEGKPLPEQPVVDPETRIEKASEYAGVYRGSDGSAIELRAEGDRLFLLAAGKRTPIERVDSGLLAPVNGFDRFRFAFTRADGEKGHVMEVANGERWWTREGTRPTDSEALPDPLKAFVGTYRSENPWVGTARVVDRRGRLWLDGTTALEQTGPNQFRPTDPAHNPEWIEFTHVIDGAAMRMTITGDELLRIEV